MRELTINEIGELSLGKLAELPAEVLGQWLARQFEHTARVVVLHCSKSIAASEEH